MKKLAISIVTYNRAKHIREDLAIIAQPTKEQGIDIYIFDGSTEERTRQVADQYIAKGYDHIHYFYMGKPLSPEESAFQRITSAFDMPDAEYVWFCGDKFTIRPEYYSEILSYIQKGYDIITIYGYILHGTRTFDSVSRFADYAIVPITHFGSTIIRKELMQPYDVRAEMKRIPSFGVQGIYLQAIANKGDFKGVVIDAKKQCQIMSKYHTASISSSYMWLTWMVNWHRFIELLPPAYDSVREGLYNRPDLQMGFFSLKELLRQRAEGQFDWKQYWECKEIIKKVIVMPNLFVFCISLLPRGVAGWLWKYYDYGIKMTIGIKNGVRVKVEKM